MKRFRLFSTLIIVALLIALVPATSAQDSTFGLSPEDFQSLMTANAMTASATSAQFTFTLGLSGSGSDPADNFDLNLTGSGHYGADAAGNPLFQLLIGGSATSEGTESPVNAELRLVNNSLYISLPDMLGPQFLEVTEADLQTMMSELPIDPEAIASGDLSSLEGMEGMENMDQMAAVLGAFGSIPFDQYIQMTRNGDQFTTTFDFQGLLSSAEFQNAIVTAAQSDPNADPAEIEEGRAMLAQLPAALAGSSFNLDQYVTDGMVSRIVLNLVLNVDAAAIGEPAEDSGNFTFNFDVNLSNFNQPVSVEVPANTMPASQMLGGM